MEFRFHKMRYDLIQHDRFVSFVKSARFLCRWSAMCDSQKPIILVDKLNEKSALKMKKKLLDQFYIEIGTQNGNTVKMATVFVLHVNNNNIKRK